MEVKNIEIISLIFAALETTRRHMTLSLFNAPKFG